MTDENRPPQFWVNQQVDLRLQELKRDLDSAQRDLREQIRRADGQQNLISLVDERMKEIRDRVDKVEKAIRDEMLSREDFKPYRNGIVAIITAVGMAVLGALLKVVIIPH